MSFETKKCFKKHEKIHSETNNENQCEICGKKVKHKEELNQHMAENHHKNAYLLSTECQTCIEEKGVCNGCLDDIIAKGNDDN